MHIFEEASPTIIGQMVTPKNIGDFFLESSYYFYCWDDLMELEYGQCVRNKKKYYFISEFAEAIMKRGFFCDKPLYAECNIKFDGKEKAVRGCSLTGRRCT